MTNKNGHGFQNVYIRPRSAVDSAQWDLGITRMRRTLFELIIIVIVIARMTRNDPLTKTWMVNSSSFGSRFGTVRLGYNSQV